MQARQTPCSSSIVRPHQVQNICNTGSSSSSHNSSHRSSSMAAIDISCRVKGKGKGNQLHQPCNKDSTEGSLAQTPCMPGMQAITLPSYRQKVSTAGMAVAVLAGTCLQ